VDNFPMQLTRVKVHASQHEGVVQCLPSCFTNNGNNAKQCSTPSIPKQQQQQNITGRGVPTHRGPNAGQSKGRARQVLQKQFEQHYVFASGSGRLLVNVRIFHPKHQDTRIATAARPHLESPARRYTAVWRPETDIARGIRQISSMRRATEQATKPRF
jgi:hypothetical protein